MSLTQPFLFLRCKLIAFCHVHVSDAEIFRCHLIIMTCFFISGFGCAVFEDPFEHHVSHLMEERIFIR